MPRMTKSAVLAATTSGISLVAGVYVGHILTLKRITDKYEALIEEQVTKAKAFYSQRNKTGEFADPVVLAEKLTGDTEEQVDDPVRPIADDEDEDYIVVDGKPFRETLTPEERINYNRMSENYTGPAVERQTYIQNPVTPDTGESMADYERRLMEAAHEKVQSVLDRVGMDEVGEEEETVVSNIFDTNGVPSLPTPSDRSPDRPYIISAREFTENDLEHSQTTITYYAGDDTLADERSQPISDINSVVGRNNLQFGNGSEDANLVYIRNEHLEVDFEVCLEPATYAEEVLGVAPPEARKRNGRL